MADRTELESEGDRRPQQASQRPLRVLVLDNDPDARAFVRRALRADARVIGQGVARRARQMLQIGYYDVLVLDLILSGTNGLKFLQHLPVASRPRRVVVLTGWRDGMTAARQFGVQAMLHKPCTPEALRQAVLGTSQPQAEYLNAMAAESPPSRAS